MMHEIKLKQDFTEAVSSGRKSFEVRKNDRGYCIIGVQNETEYFIRRRQRMMFTLPEEEGD